MSNSNNLPPEEHNVHSVYRPDIDGLRAVAILSVVAFHAFPSWLPGGFVGVDIFFVISGFLISNIIFRSLQRGDFSFTEFYAHRVKRIFPALIGVLTACYAVGWFVLLPDEFKQLGKHMAAGAGFVQNFILWKEVGYFDTAAELKPLLHLWSLAIEEQFYLIYPVLIFFAWRVRINVLTVVLLLGLISFGLNISWVSAHPTATFFMPLTRFWELLAGSVLAYLQFFHGAKLTSWMQRWAFHAVLFRHPFQSAARRGEVLNSVLSVVGLLLLIVAVLFINKNRSFPGNWAVLPALGAFLLIHAGPEAWGNRVVLANRSMVFVGLISYPLYLWHWPILSFARVIEGEMLSNEIRISAVVLSFVLAWLTYRLIEKPIRFGKKTWIKMPALSVALAVVGYVGYNAFQRNGLEFRAAQLINISKAAGEWDYPGKLLSAELDGIGYYYLQSGRPSVTLYVGDSNIEQYFPRAEALIESDPKNTNGIIFKTGGGCLPIPDLQYDAEHKHCSVLMQNAIRIAKEKPEVDTVVIGAQWNGLTLGYGLTKPFGVGSGEYIEALKKLGVYIEELRALNKRVFLVLNIPTGDQLDPKYMVKRNLGDFPRVLSIRSGGIPRADLEDAYGQVQADLARVAIDTGGTVIKPMHSLCASNCAGVDSDGEPMYKDGYHLRPSYVRRHADFIDATVK